MDAFEKYKLDKSEFLLTKDFPKVIDKYVYDIETDEFDKIYINENGHLKLAASGSTGYFLITQLFLKKYRKNPELLPTDITWEYPLINISSEEILERMKLMLEPLNTYDEFIKAIKKANKILVPYKKKNGLKFDVNDPSDADHYFAYYHYTFVDKKEDIPKKQMNIYGTEEIEPYIVIYTTPQNTYEIYIGEERSNRINLRATFYEEKYLYEYLFEFAVGVITL